MLEQLDIRNRITEIRRMRLGDVASNPNNWRGHPQEQRNVFKGVVKEIGWAGVPLAYHSERTGKLTYVDGHMRREELPNLEAEIAITDLNDAEADEFIMLYDPIARLAETDSEILATLMRGTTTLDKDISEFLSKMAEREGIIPQDIQVPENFAEYDENIDTEHQCPKCGYKWSGGK